MTIAGHGVSVSSILAVFAAGFLAWNLKPTPTETVQVTEYKYVVPADMQRLFREAQIERSGLRARLEGRHEVEPVVVVQTDTVVSPPDTVLVAVRMTSAGDLETGRLARMDSLYAPEYVTRRFGNCDEGWSWSGGTFTCDPARLGHLYAYGGLRADWPPGGAALAGLWWQPSYRSPWRVSLAASSRGRLELTIRYGYKLF